MLHGYFTIQSQLYNNNNKNNTKKESTKLIINNKSKIDRTKNTVYNEFIRLYNYIKRKKNHRSTLPKVTKWRRNLEIRKYNRFLYKN